ncbi:unnamed protein product [Adineta ricciae]|uniref:PB1 domain-containing protein n=1 Tax=Adineta ricciae TaxID=249248 RepID=A0A814INU1_ADIRI|nr:unnamed protein product [Adineta ricciae]
MTSSPTSSACATMNDDKLSGQLIIKAQLADDIRKMMIHNEDLTLNELVLMMQRIFVGKISNTDDLIIKYLDDDGDKVTLSNDGDLTVALHFHKVLRLFVFVNGNEQVNTNSDKQGDFIDEKTFRTELQAIRNSVQTILDRLQLPTNDVSDAPAANEVEAQKSVAATAETSQLNANHIPNFSQAPPTNTNKTIQSQTSATNFVPSVFKPEQDARTNTFGPPPTTFTGVLPALNNTTPRFPPVVTPNSNGPPTIHSPSTPPTATTAHQYHQPTASPTTSSPQPPPQQGGYYGQQQSVYQQRPAHPSYATNNAYPPQQPTANSSPFAHASSPPPPPMAAQQPYGAYPPQNSYYNPVQQYHPQS